MAAFGAGLLWVHLGPAFGALDGHLDSPGICGFSMSRENRRIVAKVPRKMTESLEVRWLWVARGRPAPGRDALGSAGGGGQTKVRPIRD